MLPKIICAIIFVLFALTNVQALDFETFEYPIYLIGIKDQNGFGWIEAVLFLAILTILAVIAIPNMDMLTGIEGRLADANMEAFNMRGAAIAYQINNDRYPADSDELWNEPASPSDYINEPRAYYTFNIGNGRISSATINTPRHIPDDPWMAIRWDSTLDKWVKQ